MILHGIQGPVSAMIQVMACHMFDAKPLYEPMLTYSLMDLSKQISLESESKSK